MKRLHFFLALLLCVVISFGVFSNSAYAQNNIVNDNWLISENADDNSTLREFKLLSEPYFYVYKGYSEPYIAREGYGNVSFYDLGTDYKIVYYPMGLTESLPNVIDLREITSTNSYDLNYNINFTLSNIGVCEYSENIRYFVYYLDDNFNQITYDTILGEVVYLGRTYTYDFSCTFKPHGQARYIYIVIDTGWFTTDVAGQINWTWNNCTMNVDVPFEDDILREDEKQSSWLGKIWDSITSLPSKIVDGITQAIKDLFIPSEEDIAEVKDDWESLLSDRFGAVYESSVIIDDWANAFAYYDTNETVTFPYVSVVLAGSEFTFGGWEVDVVPDGFEEIIDVLKVIVNISCTFLFVNAMKKRLEGVLT